MSNARTWKVGLAAAVLSLLPSAAAAQEAPDVTQLVGFIRWSGVLASIALFVVAAMVARLVTGVSERLVQRFTQQRPLIQKVESATNFLLYLGVAAASVGLSIRLDPTAMTVIGGALAFAVGFAMRDLVAALIAGITILFDRPFQVGDRVNYAGEYGEIIKIGLRSVQMNTLDDNIVTIPNNKVLTDVTSSGNYGALEMQVPMDFYVGTDQDATLARDLVREACLTSPYVFLERAVPVSIHQTVAGELFALHIKARPYVFDCKHEKEFETDVNLRVLQAFREHGILPPAQLQRESKDASAAS
jgi:small-conductance mechanosensitive channel